MALDVVGGSGGVRRWRSTGIIVGQGSFVRDGVLGVINDWVIPERVIYQMGP